MSLNRTIINRKSIRSYLSTPLTALEVSEICECIHNIKPLIEGIPYTMKVVDRALFDSSYGGLFKVKAPNYVVIHSREEHGFLVNSGYVGQMLMLGLTAKGYATCWLGGVKQKTDKSADELKYIIAFAVGRSEENFRLSETDADRKPLEDLVSGSPEIHMDAIRAGRLAPSAMNMQPVRYMSIGKHLHVFRSKKAGVMGLFDRLQAIDTGIAIAVIIASDPKYTFSVLPERPLLKGCIYVGTLTKED